MPQLLSEPRSEGVLALLACTTFGQQMPRQSLKCSALNFKSDSSFDQFDSHPAAHSNGIDLQDH